MRIIARKMLVYFWQRHPESEHPLKAWFSEVRRAQWRNFAEVRATFNSVDRVGERLVFNIGGSKFRLVTLVDFQRHGILIRFIGLISNITGLMRQKSRSSTMNIKPLRSPQDFEQALAYIAAHWGAAPGSDEGDKLDVLMTLVDAYEAEYFPIEAPDPVAAIKFRMEQGGLCRKDLEAVLGSRSRVSEILNHKRRLTVNMIWNLHKAFGIPLESLSQPYEPKQAAS